MQGKRSIAWEGKRDDTKERAQMRNGSLEDCAESQLSQGTGCSWPRLGTNVTIACSLQVFCASSVLSIFSAHSSDVQSCVVVNSATDDLCYVHHHGTERHCLHNTDADPAFHLG